LIQAAKIIKTGLSITSLIGAGLGIDVIFAKEWFSFC
jgi:hypothetical protein